VFRGAHIDAATRPGPEYAAAYVAPASRLLWACTKAPHRSCDQRSNFERGVRQPVGATRTLLEAAADDSSLNRQPLEVGGDLLLQSGRQIVIPETVFDEAVTTSDPNAPGFARSDSIASWVRANSGTSRLRPQDWKSGGRLVEVEIIAPFGRAQEMVKDLRANVFVGRR